MTLEQLEKKIKKEFALAEKNAKKKTKEYFEQFEKADKAMKEKVKDGIIKQSEYKKWRTIQMMQGKAYKELEMQLTQDYYNAHEIANRMINDNSPLTYASNVNRSTYEIERQGGIDTSFILYDESTVRSLIIDDPNLLPEAKLPKGFRKWEKSKINSAVLQGVLGGDSVDKIANRLRAVTNSSISSSVRTARTITTACENKGRLDAYYRAEDMGIELEKKWVATNDSRTRHSHAMMDGETVGIDEEFSNGLQYPADPNGEPSEVYNCRCTMTTQIKKIFGNKIKKDYEVSTEPYMEWVNSHD